MFDYFATASRGTETVLAEELTELGIEGVEQQRGGVSFSGSLEQGYLACLWSRVASRVLLRLNAFEADDAQSLYDGVRHVDWNEHIDPDRTLAVDVAGKSSPAGPGHFLALKVKDAIVDTVREKHDRRPNVDTARPDLRVHLHVRERHATLYIDLAGRGLHRRGFGRLAADAPLKENLAAAILRLAGWHRCPEKPLVDPLCGSGTLLIEAAWMARNIAPGLSRHRIGAQGWLGHDAELWKRLREEAEDKRVSVQELQIRLAGSDASETVARAARQNIMRAGLGNQIKISRRDLRDAQTPWDEPGLVVTNPPYGERLGEETELASLYEQLGDVLKHRFPGWSCWIFTGNPKLAKRIGLRPRARIPLFNGPIDSRLLDIPIGDAPVAGGDGPGWRKPSKEADAFARRLEGCWREASAWARDEALTCFRIYDAEMQEYNLAVDWYDGAARIEEYSRPKKVSVEIAERHLRDAMLTVPAVLGISPDDVSLKVERRPRDNESRSGEKIRMVREGQIHFLADLCNSPDTGLALARRLLRRHIRDQSSGRSFLDLFARSCTAAVSAAKGGAASTTCIDPDARLLALGKKNFELNGIESPWNRFECCAGVEWIARRDLHQKFDRILIAPPDPTRGRSAERGCDLQREHVQLLFDASRSLERDGEILLLATHRNFELEIGRLGRFDLREMSEAFTPWDFRHRTPFKAWSLTLRNPNS